MLVRFVIVTVMMTLCTFSTWAQQVKNKARIYRVHLMTVGERKPVKGVIYELRDSSLLLSNSSYRKDIEKSRMTLSEWRYSQIESIEIRRIEKTTGSVILGASIGLVFGGIIGLSQRDDEAGSGINILPLTRGQKATFIGLPLGFLGGILGDIAGVKKKSFIVGGRFDQFQISKEGLREYSFLSQELVEAD